MTQEEKSLLLKDLCARLPYRVHCCVYNMNGSLRIEDDVIYYCADVNVVTYNSFENECFMLWQIKPYLRPMLSMTEEERLLFHQNTLKYNEVTGYSEYTYKSIDWLNAHHFDYRGLIPMGLALEAPKGMYK